jgi:hypothetical protein
MELIQSAMRRSHSRESGRSGRSAEGTSSRHGHPPQGPNYNDVGASNYDDNDSVHSSEDSILPENYEHTKNDPIGKILLDIAHDQTMLAKKCKLENMNVNIHELCDNFGRFMDLGEELRQRHSERTQDEMEQRLIKKKLSSHLINQAFRPPSFSKTPALTSVGRTSEIMKLFPHRNNKFSGHPKDSLSLLEFITSLNAAQEQAHLTEKEFRNMLLSCTTGPAHQFLIDWMEDNDEDMASTYHQLALRFDNRMTAEEAKKQLFNYKAPRDKTLAQVESHIMSLAHRASTIYQPGDARKQARDLESCDTLIRCLPPASSDMVRKVHGELCTELGKPCSATDLSRALHNLRHSIDADIRLHGMGESRSRNKYPARNHPKNRENSYSSYSISTAVTPPTTSPAPMRNVALSARGRQRSTSGQRRAFPPSTSPRPSSGGPRRGSYRRGPRRLAQITGCSLCGQKNHGTTNCPNMRNASGKLIRVHPVQGTCGLCPGSRKNTLHHPQSLCPYKINGCLHGQ